MKKFPTIDQLVEAAVKCGHNADDARGVIEKAYWHLEKGWYGYPLKKLVHIAYVIY
jgi:hypothetical protein